MAEHPFTNGRAESAWNHILQRQPDAEGFEHVAGPDIPRSLAPQVLLGRVGSELRIDLQEPENICQSLRERMPEFLIQINPQILGWEEFHIAFELLMVKTEFKEGVEQIKFVGLTVEIRFHQFSK